MPSTGTNPPRYHGEPGLFAHLSAYLGAIAKYLRARLQLLGIETKEAALHYVIIIALLFAALVVVIFGYLFFCFGLVFAIAALIGGKYTWIWVTFGMALLHFAAAAGAVFLAKSRLSAPMFTSTLQEFRKDQEWLTNENKR
jgi:uncharacterized membrane protein YqjE